MSCEDHALNLLFGAFVCYPPLPERKNDCFVFQRVLRSEVSQGEILCLELHSPHLPPLTPISQSSFWFSTYCEPQLASLTIFPSILSLSLSLSLSLFLLPFPFPVSVSPLRFTVKLLGKHSYYCLLLEILIHFNPWFYPPVFTSSAAAS
jgi:hypothetical protein